MRSLAKFALKYNINTQQLWFYTEILHTQFNPNKITDINAIPLFHCE